MFTINTRYRVSQVTEVQLFFFFLFPVSQITTLLLPTPYSLLPTHNENYCLFIHKPSV